MSNIKTEVDSTDLTSKYSARKISFSAEFIAEQNLLKTHVTYFNIALIWCCIFVLSFIGQKLFAGPYFWVIYLGLGFLIAGRQGALLQIVHEGSHRLISSIKFRNDFIGNWLAALPVGLTLEGYTNGHMKHHAGTNTVDDLATDLEKYLVTDVKDWRLYKLFLCDLFGITALKSFFGHNYKSLKTKKHNDENSIDRGLRLFRLATSQLLILAFLFQFNLMFYFLFWAFPLVSFNMLLLRVRGITEHGAPNQLHLKILTADQGNLYTRSVVLTKPNPLKYLVFQLERILIGSLSANYHHEHHLLPKVPFYNLKNVHNFAHQDIKKLNKFVYVDGYFSTLFFSKATND
ncbi:MAG: fatty acid desaturase [Bacteriovoracaceae bacterium]|nr:fatty acid desaturase [Bacteriovoracaceae bacterium]